MRTVEAPLAQSTELHASILTVYSVYGSRLVMLTASSEVVTEIETGRIFTTYCVMMPLGVEGGSHVIDMLAAERATSKGGENPAGVFHGTEQRTPP